MATVQIEAYVTLTKYDWEEKPRYTLDCCDMSEHNTDAITLRKQTFDVEVPDEFDTRLARIDNLRKKQRKVMAEAVAAQTELEEQIQRLLCIEAPKSAPADDGEVIL
jgi:hypothetical protein